MMNIQDGGLHTYESADDVKYKNDVEYKNDVVFVHERIAKCLELECRDGPQGDNSKTAK